MDPSNWLLLDLNLSLSDANAPRFESSNDSFLHQQSKNEENGELVEELYRMNTENKKLTQMLTSICDNYQVLHSQLINYMGKNPKLENCVESDPKKRKAYFEVLNSEEIQGNSEQSCISYEDSCKRTRFLNSKPKVSMISIRTENSDTKLVVKDGYQWRKYGQKVTRDNPSPRAYFKCASALTACPVKKKVQRSMEDPYILVATYEGDHNHAKPSSRDIDHIVLGSSHPLNSSYFSETNPNMNRHESMMSPNSSNSKIDDERKSPNSVDEDTKSLQRFLTEKIVESLTRDPSFKTTLATAISGKMMNGTI